MQKDVRGARRESPGGRRCSVSDGAAASCYPARPTDLDRPRGRSGSASGGSSTSSSHPIDFRVDGYGLATDGDHTPEAGPRWSLACVSCGALLMRVHERPARPASRSIPLSLEAPSAPSSASTTGSAFPRYAWSARTASRSASSPSATRCAWLRSPISTWSRSHPRPARRSASSWTTASSSTNRP